MNTIERTLNFQRSTKGTHVYTDDAPDAPIKTLYIQKEGMPTNAPSAITVTISAPASE